MAELLENFSGRIRAVKDAMRRLETGAYGVCRDCGEAIASRRLQALPFAVLCLGCQQRNELEPKAAARGAHRAIAPCD